MEYFKLLNLTKEPFSNSPDPDFFFQSAQHVDCLQKLELSLRLRRGLNVVIGEVGTGKTTLCRQLIRKFSDDTRFEILLILDPFFKKPEDALITLADLFGLEKNEFQDEKGIERNIKEQIKQHLFLKGVEKGKTLVLIIDEGQKMPLWLIEVLRELLNYETNQYKLLQIVIFAQKEFESVLSQYHNFADRISLFHRLHPLSFLNMIRMIGFRLEKAGFNGSVFSFFSYPALWYIFRSTGGYPRKVIHLCHQAMLLTVVQNKPRVVRSVVRACAKSGVFNTPSHPKWVTSGLLALTGIVVFSFFFAPFSDGQLERTRFEMNAPPAAVPPFSEPFSDQIEEKTDKVSSDFIAKPPEMLGQLSVNKRETLGELVRNVYGTYNPQLLKAVLAANPHVGSPHRISIGERITFPAREVHISSEDLEGFRIEIAETRRLEEALALFRSYSGRGETGIRIIPNWNRTSDLKFTLVLDEYLPDKAHAYERSSILQPVFGQPLKVAQGWAEDTKLYATLPVY